MTLDKIIYEFSQEGNTDGTTEDWEEMTIEVQGCHKCITEGDGYLVLRTKTGWSVNSTADFEEMLSIVNNGVIIPQL